MDIANVEKVEADLNRFIERRAKDSEGARARANAEDAFWRSRDARRNHAARLENARGWVEHFGALALMHHDAAARAAEQRDKALALVEELEATNERKSA